MAQVEAEFIRGVIGSHNLIVDEKPQIAFIGRSNVGKSSVINMLTGRKNLVKISGTPGKTQQINFFLINGTHYFVDLPGYGYAKLSQKHREKMRKLILWYLISGEAPISKAVLIIDVKAGLREFDHDMIRILREQELSFVIIANKIDKVNQKKRHAALVDIAEKAGVDSIVIPVSAVNGTGREQVLRAIDVL